MKRIIRKGYRIIGMKGGGGTTTTTSSSGVPDWLKPDVQQAFNNATTASNAGDLENVAQHSKGQQDLLANTAEHGLGAATGAQLASLQGQQLAGTANSGGLNSARADRARQAGLADASAKFAGQDLNIRNQAHGELQQQAQTEGDAKHQGLQRLFGYFGSGAAGQSSTSTAPKSGGGK